MKTHNPGKDNIMSVCLFAAVVLCSKPWKMMYQMKTHNPGKVNIMFLRPYNQ